MWANVILIQAPPLFFPSFFSTLSLRGHRLSVYTVGATFNLSTLQDSNPLRVTQTLFEYLLRTFPQEPAPAVVGSQRGAELLVMPKQITEVSPAGDSLPGLHTSGNPQLSPLDRTSAFLTRSSGTIMHFVLDHCAKCFVCTHLHQCS